MATATEAPAHAGGPTSHTPNRPAPAGSGTHGYTRDQQQEALKRLREPFTQEQISTRPEIDCTACENANGGVCGSHYPVECPECGQIITVAHTDLRFVDHAEATDRLLDADPFWGWEPLASDRAGLPLVDEKGGLWIRLTVAGVSRLGYGDTRSKLRGTSATKELIGNAIRNAGMRFGMGLDLWKASGRRDRDNARRPPGFPEADSFRLAQLTGWARTNWGRLDKLRELLEMATQEEFAESLIPAGNDVVTFGPMLARRIAELEQPPAGPQQPPAQQTSGQSAEGSQDTGMPAPGEAPDAPHQDEPDHSDPDTGAATGEDEILRKMTERVRLHWEKPFLLEQDLTEVGRLGLLDHNVEGPPEWNGAWMRFEMLLDRRLGELKDATTNDAPGRAA
ncbi:hypothetical protein [Streptomyces sp.]|uniref:hypothetical protein n=1 Tax=Streptomyces sp. TaxID=1931 RepID=UPI002F40E6D7